MAIVLNGTKYYRLYEACEKAGIGVSTYYRWVKDGEIEDVTYTDRRGWRIFTEEDVERLSNEVNKIVVKQKINNN